MNGAVAIFVKTPGISPLKTRLAQGIGRDQADEFYAQSLKAVEAVVTRATFDLAGLHSYWAVAEMQGMGHELWRRFSTIEQGSGGLGERLFQVSSQLLKKHDFVILIGADSPQISCKILVEAAEVLANKESRTRSFVLGKATDGGFYLFGTQKELSLSIWQGISYSQSDTAIKLENQLTLQGQVHPLRVLSDVDTVEDLSQILDQFVRDEDLLPEQRAIKNWIGQCLKS